MARNVKQSSVADLTAHLGVERGAIDNNIYFVRLFPGQNRFNDCFGFKEIVTEKFRWRGLEFAFFDTDVLFFLSFARALAL
ncbi:MAG: hypothetical protein DME59_16625 [Verrucomicrobia bacterium]|nr:MAG: hypothetical protein DME59_16625 [Verrucomicrobiota bacterium]